MGVVLDKMYMLMHMWAFAVFAAFIGVERSLSASKDSITFLVTVNDTWKWDPPIYNDTCMVTVKTNPLLPNRPLNKTEKVIVGDCDSGPLVYTVNSDGNGKATVDLTFHSSVIEDASPPACSIDWNHSYLLPSHTLGPGSREVAEESLLPGCFTADSREGYHMTNYWFYVLDWTHNNKALQKPDVSRPLSVSTVSFLVAINQTNSHCINTTRTPPLQPGVGHDKIHLGDCDYGTLDFTITTAGKEHTYVELTWHYSHDDKLSDPLPVASCKILWDYSYKVPSASNFQRSLLPGCYTTVSRGTLDMTYYWFYVIDWSFG